jgi:hypothetical protein
MPNDGKIAGPPSCRGNVLPRAMMSNSRGPDKVLAQAAVGRFDHLVAEWGLMRHAGHHVGSGAGLEGARQRIFTLAWIPR